MQKGDFKWKLKPANYDNHKTQKFNADVSELIYVKNDGL